MSQLVGRPEVVVVFFVRGRWEGRGVDCVGGGGFVVVVSVTVFCLVF